MVSGDHHHVAATEGSRPAEEAVIQLLRPVARRSGVENVARHHQDVDPVVPDRLGQPVQKGFVFLVPFSAVEGAAEMPVRRVEDFHFRCVRAPSRARKGMSPGQRGAAGVRKRLSGEGFILFMGTPPVRCLHCRPIPPGRQFPVARWPGMIAALKSRATKGLIGSHFSSSSASFYPFQPPSRKVISNNVFKKQKVHCLFVIMPPE